HRENSAWTREERLESPVRRCGASLPLWLRINSDSRNRSSWWPAHSAYLAPRLRKLSIGKRYHQRRSYHVRDWERHPLRWREFQHQRQWRPLHSVGSQPEILDCRDG